MKKYKNVGGQAVIEGVMMRGKNGMATAVRLNNGEIVVEKENKPPLTQRHKILGLPFIRGIASFADSLVTGIKILNYSASFFQEEDGEEEEGKFDKWFKEKFKENSSNVIVGISLCLSLVLSFFLFFAMPTFITGLLKNVIDKRFVLNIVEGVIRVLILVLYMLIVSRMEDIKRVFQYHGAEHKTIFCYEADEELTVENVKAFERFHPRCGTNFIFLVMVISIIVFSAVSWNSLWQRLIFRILLLPVVVGISYEVIKWMGKSNSFLSNFFAYPGLLLQRITTKEPYDDQIEVAIRALKEAEGIYCDVLPEHGDE
ncbi:Uncharacterized conserved protein YqhQ [Hathewaya proteolytica DSM 3090]|uniref:Uncharacterized conserved protein YqhQ n=1 Tax=Hathewaya proteolytica DSM 3090 TaxID=1121331 RepID=A0A1M6S8Y5_9CLOT|nr:DUF1385 domain-containing protein [Hathewaya proteolytica]SHK40987.1 Uncharacterized conserved protein YqhQ [Hathewaya proteolytica DSM 3090]